MADSLGPVSLRVPPHVRPAGARWRFDPEHEGTRVVLLYPYAAQTRWVRALAHEVTQWALRRQVQRHVDRLVQACLDGARSTT